MLLFIIARVVVSTARRQARDSETEAQLSECLSVCLLSKKGDNELCLVDNFRV